MQTALDVAVLQALRRRQAFGALARGVPQGALHDTTRRILGAYGRFFKDNPECGVLVAESFVPYFHALHIKMDDGVRALHSAALDAAFAEPAPQVIDALLPRLAEARLALELQTISERYAAGEDADVIAETAAAHARVSAWVQQGAKDAQCLTDIGDILAEEENDSGLHWRWPTFRANIKPMRPGDFYIFAGGVDSGKTTAMADIVSFIAPQLAGYYNEPRDVLWLNNEGMSERIVQRVWQSALGITTEEMVKLNRTEPQSDPKYRTRLRELYAAAVGGRLGSIRVMSIHGYTSGQVERLLNGRRNGLIVFDMIDHIDFEGNLKGDRTDQVLAAQYEWARLLGVRYECPVIATSQLSGEGSFMPYPLQTMLKDSRVGKQAAADVQVTLGRVPAEELAHIRYIGTPKNKRARTGCPSWLRFETFFDKDRARVRDVKES